MTDTLAGPPVRCPTAARGQVDEESLGAALLEEGTEENEEDHVGGQDVGHDAEHAVALVEDADAQLGERRPAWEIRSGAL